MRSILRLAVLLVLASLLSGVEAQTAPMQGIQTPVYTPKFPGDPAHSDAEAAALGYMRTVVNAQKVFHKRHNAWATSLHELVGQGSFTRRMEKTDRGDYTVRFRSTGKEYSLSLIPRQFDASRRAFYVDETGEFRVEADKPATRSSPPLKQD